MSYARIMKDDEYVPCYLWSVLKPEDVKVEIVLEENIVDAKEGDTIFDKISTQEIGQIELTSEGKQIIDITNEYTKSYVINGYRDLNLRICTSPVLSSINLIMEVDRR